MPPTRPGTARGRALAPGEEPEEHGQHDGEEDRGAEWKIESPRSPLDVDVSRHSSEPWRLSREVGDEQQKSPKEYHHEPDAEKDFPQIRHEEVLDGQRSLPAGRRR